MNRSLAKGTAWATTIVDALKQAGWPYAERRALAGAKDRGDIAGLPSVVIEAKAEARTDLAGWLREAHKERDNDHANIGVAWIKKRGKTSALDGYVLMDGLTFLDLLHDAGYGGKAHG